MKYTRLHARSLGATCFHAISLRTTGGSTSYSTGFRQRLSWESRHPRASQSWRCIASSTTEPAVIIVDHGSRREESNRQLEQFVELYRDASQRQMVVAAHMEIAKPSIADAIKECSAAGYKRVVVAPYFLSSGRHIQQDIPALVAEALEAHPHIECSVADPIGLDSTLASLIERRVQSALNARDSS